jgi:hypothetical protein
MRKGVSSVASNLQAPTIANVNATFSELAPTCSSFIGSYCSLFVTLLFSVFISWIDKAMANDIIT